MISLDLIRALVGMQRFTLFGMVTLLLAANTSCAASFDCSKAGTKVEKMICADPELSKLDGELGKAYSAALKKNSDPSTLKQQQRDWLKERDKCDSADCLRTVYQQRIAKIQSPVQSSVASESNGEQCLQPKIDWRNYEWTLITGAGEAVCEDMLAYLKSRPNDIAPPTCPDERLPKNGNWSRPESRILSEIEKQAILQNIPEQFRQKPGGPVSFERQIAGTKLLRVITGDITRDGKPESFLAFGRHDDYRLTCERSKRCARPEEIFRKGINLTSDSYYLLPMDRDGKRVDWSHRTVRVGHPLLMGGVLIYFKGAPYWMTGVSWNQHTHDDYTHYRVWRDDPYSAMFSMDNVSTYSSVNPQSKSFEDVTNVSPLITDPKDTRVCRFGYFNRDNLTQYPASKGTKHD